MARERVHYSIEERQRLRRALLEHFEHKKLSYQELANDIAERINYGLIGDSGRRRVERFLKGQGEPNNDFIGAITRYLGSVPPPDIEHGAATLAHFFSRSWGKAVKLDDLAGRYHVYASTDRRNNQGIGFSEITVMNQLAEFRPAPVAPLASKVAYAVIEMKPMQKSNALLVFENVFNFFADPEIDSFPEGSLRNDEAGVFVGFGFSDRSVPRFLMATRTVIETRLYRLHKVEDKPLTLRGELNFSGKIGRPNHMTHSNPLHPDYEIEMVRVEDTGDGEENGIPLTIEMG